MALPIVDGVEFRAIEGWPGYAVGDDGTVWSNKNVNLEWMKLRTWIQNRGYQLVSLWSNGSKKRLLVHRIVLLAFVGKPPEGYESCHNNGVRSDSRLSNLRWDSKSNNQLDKVSHGTHLNFYRIPPSKGETNGRAKLTNDQALEIRRRRNGGEKGRLLAVEFGVSEQTVCMIAKNHVWKHLG